MTPMLAGAPAAMTIACRRQLDAIQQNTATDVDALVAARLPQHMLLAAITLMRRPPAANWLRQQLTAGGSSHGAGVPADARAVLLLLLRHRGWFPLCCWRCY